MERAVILGLGLATAVLAQPGPVREGAAWVETFTGSEALRGAAKLRIGARGDVTLLGAPGGVVSWTVKTSARARTREEARGLLREPGLRVGRQGEWVYLMLPAAGVAALTVRVPAGIREVALSTREGSLTIRDLKSMVHASTGGGRVWADRVAGDFNVSTAGGDIVLGNMGGAVHVVTAGGRITAGVIRGAGIFETGGGDILVQEVGGVARASTGAGGVRITRAGGPVIASTVGGPIEVGEAHGPVTARNAGGGPVEVGSAWGVSCENAAGGVRLQNVFGSLRVSTAFGNIVARLLAGRPLADSFLSTANGDITVFIPSNVGVMIRAQNESADSLRRIVSDFPGLAVRLVGSMVVAEGAINGGGPLLRISGTGGTIFIRRSHP